MTSELETILFLHVLFGLLLVGGGFALLVLIRRAQRAASLTAARATLDGALMLGRYLLIPAGLLTGIIGFLLGFRYDAELASFDLGEAIWMHIAGTLWLVTLVAWLILDRGLARTLRLAEPSAADDGRGLEAVKKAVGSARVSGLMWLNTVLGLVILYLMIFQPLADDVGRYARRGVLVTTELNVILFVHVLFAMALVGGIAAHALLYLRFRRSNDPITLQTTLTNLRGIENALVIGNSVLVGVIGLLLAWRYDAKGILSFGDSTWLHISIALWIVANVIGFFETRSLKGALDTGTAGESNVAGMRAALNSPVYPVLAAVNIVMVLALVYLMVFQP
jgi:uncharacterized membrane protein